MANKVIADWFDGLEAVLEKEATVAGLLQHGSTIGQAREFLVARVLRTILPPSIHIGTGKVIDHLSHVSKQIDVVVYDPRFPIMELAGGGLYLVEGTLATIEVKSTINRSELIRSLDNSKSVLELDPKLEHRDQAMAQIEFYKKKFGIDDHDAGQTLSYMLRPATYIFGFKSTISFDATAKCVMSWWQKIGCPWSSYFPALPKVIATGRVVGVSNDGRMTISANISTNHVMSVFRTDLRFRWFALHLMDSVSRRLGHRN